VWGTFCDWYLEFTKPILQAEDADARAETQATTAWVLAQTVHLLHPVMPFLTEEVWQQLAGADAGMLIVAPWPDLPPELADPAAAAEMEALIEDLSAIRAVRSELNIPPGARIEVEVRDADPVASARIATHAEHFQRLARVNLRLPAGPASAEARGTVQAVGAGATFALHVGNVVDLAREKARLAKEIAKTESDLAKVATKLANPAFLANAKPEIVDEQRDREADIRRDRDRLKAAYERLEAV
jgi:valyl-tRNA synthetase